MHRLKELFAILLIGDGVVALIAPTRHSVLWRPGPPGWSRAMTWFEQHPVFTRALAGAELVGGLLIAARQWRGAAAPSVV